MFRVENLVSQRWWVMAVAAMLTLALLVVGANTAKAADAPEMASGSVTAWQGDGESNGDRPSFRGLIQALPDGALIGDWQVGDKTVAVTEQTQLRDMSGPFEVGACVKVTLESQGSNTAHEIETENASDCNGSGGGHEGEDGAEVYGIVEAMPVSGTVGAWTVSAQVYNVTAQSELKTEYGAFDLGKCVKIHLVMGSTDTVREMETEPAYKCTNGGDDGEHTPPTGAIGKGEVYGELMSFPQEMVGIWAVGTLTFTADATTEFSMKNGPFTVGNIVKVEFYIMQDGTFLAREIKTAMPDMGDDDGEHHGDGSHDSSEGHAYGMIEQLPANGLMGAWIVAGVEYSVTERTELHAEGGSFAISDTVKIEFREDSNGVRVAKEIERKHVSGDPSQEDAKFVGFIESMPDAGYTGLWIVNGVEFSGTLQSKFKEDHGAFTVGAFVKVEYRTVDGVRIIHEMETEVPPGAGDDNHVGKIESKDDNVVAASLSANSTWVIGGRSFTVTPSTRVSAGLNTSDTVWVNSYAAADGTQVATRIAGVTVNNFVYLPLSIR